MFYDVFKMVGTFPRYDYEYLGRFDTMAEVEDFIEANFAEDDDTITVSDPWGEPVW